MWSSLVLLVSSFGLGAAHALEPGHGKTIVAAYLIGSRGRWYHAVHLGIVVTITHTIGILLLGLLAMGGMSRLKLDEVHDRLQLVAGVLILAVGLWLLWQRSHGHHHHHGHDHGHDHHSHEHGHAHSHAHEVTREHVHEHAHGHADPAPGHTHTHDSGAATGSRARRTIWSVTALGISGGLLPCPAAVAPLLYGVGIGEVGMGVLGVVSFSVGLALVLIAVGLLVLRAQAFVERRMEHARWMNGLPLVSAAVVSLLGLGLVVESVL